MTAIPEAARGRGRGARLRILVAVAVSAGLLALLLHWLQPGVAGQYWRQAALWYALPALLFFSANVLVRAGRLRLLAGPAAAGARRSSWVLLSARHQLVFTLLPSGLGDTGYPVLAGRLVGSDVATAIRVILTYRSQDLFALGLVGAAGLALHSMDLGLSRPAALLLLGASGVLLYGSADLVQAAARLALRALSRACAGRGVPDRIEAFLVTLAGTVRPPSRFGGRFAAAVLAVLSWALAAAAVWCAFAMTGTALDAGATMIVIAGLNLVGMFAAFTVGGLGFGEGGLAVLLLALGFAAQPAIAIALLVRPSILAMAVSSCLLVEGAVQLARRVAA